MHENFRFWLCLSLALLFLAFCVTDCTSGKNRYCPGVIREHVYHPPYVTFICNTTKSGTTCTPVWHPAQYRLLVECSSPDHVANINVGEWAYAHYRDGESVTVGESIGRWTKVIWNDWIETDFV